MSVEVANDQTSLGQFASNNGYTQLIKNASGTALTQLFNSGYSEHVPEVVSDLNTLMQSCQDPDVCSTALSLEKLIQGQELIIIHDGTSNGSTKKKVDAGGPGSDRHKGVERYRWVMDPRNNRVLLGPDERGPTIHVVHSDLFSKLFKGDWPKNYDKIPRGFLEIDHNAKVIRSDNISGDNESTPNFVLEGVIKQYPTYAIEAGGPGSGCHGPNCGKPKGTVVLKNSLRIPRSEMPQISKANLQDYLQWLGKQGIQHHAETVDPQALKPIQKTVNKNVAMALPPNVNIEGRPMVISQDSYILDGHHRWMRALMDKLPLNAVRVHTPMAKLLKITHNYPNVEYRTPQETAKKWEKKITDTPLKVAAVEAVAKRFGKAPKKKPAPLGPLSAAAVQAVRRLFAVGTSDGAKKGWDTRGRKAWPKQVEKLKKVDIKKEATQVKSVPKEDLPSPPPSKGEVAKPARTIPESQLLKPGLKVDRNTEQELTPREHEVEERFAKYIEKDPQAAVDEYRVKFGNVINPDNAKELGIDYHDDRSANASAVHEPSSWLAKQVYKQVLAEPPQDGQYRSAFFMTGGPGVGKTTAIESNKTLGGFIKNSHVVVDGTFANASSASKKIDQALAAGHDAIIAYVHRDPVDAFENGILKRAEHGREGQETGRTVPISWAANAYVNVRKSLTDLVDKYKDNPRVKFIGIDNSHGKGNAKFIKMENLPPMNDTVDQLKQKFGDILDKHYADGRVSQKVYQATKV